MNKYTDAPYGGLSGVPSDFNKKAALRKKDITVPRLARDYARDAAKPGNATRKRHQHRANLALRRSMNQAAARSPGKEPRPYSGMSA